MEKGIERFSGRVALVTGASSGIGAAICRVLVKNNLKVIGVARNIEAIQEMKKQLSKEGGELTAIACDITKDEQVYKLFETIKKDFGGVDVCVNNAGKSYYTSILDGNPDEWRDMANLNIVSLTLFCKLTVDSMKERNIDDGHIINISSVCGHTIYPGFHYLHFYTGTKHAVTTITECLRRELRTLKSNIRITAVSPGLVQTDFFRRMCNNDKKLKEFESTYDFDWVKPEDIANNVLFILSAPPYVEIDDVIIRPTGQLA